MGIDKEKIKAIESDDPAYRDFLRSLDELPDISFNPSEMVAAAKREKESDDGAKQHSRSAKTSIGLNRNDLRRLRFAKDAIESITDNPVTLRDLIMGVFEEGFKVKYPIAYERYRKFMDIFDGSSS